MTQATISDLDITITTTVTETVADIITATIINCTRITVPYIRSRSRIVHVQWGVIGTEEGEGEEEVEAVGVVDTVALGGVCRLGILTRSAKILRVSPCSQVSSSEKTLQLVKKMADRRSEFKLQALCCEKIF